MPPPFHPLTVDQFAAVLRKSNLRRRVNAVHLHHTWKPEHRDYSGHDTIAAMWRAHTRDNGWHDIAQHLSIAPDGTLWTGRPWEWPPASATGHNGNATSGPFMIEMIGNFDRGRDDFTDPQRAAAVDTVAHLLLQFGLEPEAIRFHREMSDKTCPGTSIDQNALRTAVAARMEALGSRNAGEPRGAIAPFSEEMDAVYDVLASFSAARRAPVEDGELLERSLDAELAEEQTPIWRAALSAGAGSRDIDTVELTPAVLASLRPHVVNLSNGRLTESGTFSTSLADVEAIFEQHLPKALAAAQGDQRPLRIVLYAHGGLVSEEEGMRGALKHVDWWVRNGVYPIYFVWETGVIETLRAILSGARAARDLSDFTDGEIERLARRAKADRLWTGMKVNASQAVATGGGGAIVARKLADFCAAHGDAVQVHAVGHSAGSIFHSFLLPHAVGAGVPAVRTLQFLAPAIRVDHFMERLSPDLGKKIGRLTMYTMANDFERADNVGGFYRKSLLYLIHFALEDGPETALIGLDVSVRNDIRLKRLFGINPPNPNALGEIVFSRTDHATGRHASQSTTHGGFDDDPSTMNSVLRRVLDVDNTAPIVEFVRPKSVVVQAAVPPTVGLAAAAPGGLAGAPAVLAGPSSGGARRALCVGINAYRQQPLSGCVPDTEAWAQTLRALGFLDVRMLKDMQATRAALIAELQQLVSRSAPGDVLVFQFSGHGTTLPDRSTDEAGGDTPQQDEAICPFDFTEGQFLLDDDLAAIYDAIPSGVSVTNFIDCCHSGSITRFGFGMRPAAGGLDDRPRFMTVGADVVERYLALRGTRGRSARGSASMKEVLFAACRSNELAWESRGQGDFTRAAIGLLRAGISGLTNQDFEARVIAQLGQMPRQHPELHCAAGARTQPLLQGGRAAAVGAAPTASLPAALSSALPPALAGDRAAAVAGVLDAISALLRQ
jgi:hypothetical protein